MAKKTKQALKFELKIKALMSEVYRAFIDRDGLTDWLSNGANVNPVEGGHFLVYWQDNTYVVGEYKRIEPYTKLTFTWRANSEKKESLVTVTFTQKIREILLTLKHEKLPKDADIDTYNKQWHQVLDNLKATLETGADKRITDRVIIGIIPGSVSTAQAEMTGLEAGTYAVVNDLVEGYSAAEAGIQIGDIITNINGQIVSPDLSIQEIVKQLGLKPGDTVKIAYFRAGEVHTIPVTLKGYPVPETPADFQELADQIKEKHAVRKQTLADLLENVSDEQAFKKPAEDEWSAADNLAHLILTERWLQNWVGGLLQGPEITGFTANADARIASVTAINPNKQAIIDAMFRTWDETEALLRAIGDEHLMRKTNLWWATFQMAQYDRHTQQHFLQIKEALEA